MSSTNNLRDAEPNSENGSMLQDTGAFRFIADRARPDIFVAVGEISTGGAENASDLHLKTALKVKNYSEGATVASRYLVTTVMHPTSHLGTTARVDLVAVCS